MNLARSAVKVAQASTAHGGNAERAIDGNTDGNWRGGSCTHTHHQNKPWFWIDLGKKSKIAKVSYSNSNDKHDAQLYSYFSSSSAEAICMNGV